jgi:lactoylglutathione lyase
MVRVSDLDAVARLLLQQARPHRNAPLRQRTGPLHAGLPRRAGRRGARAGRADVQLGPEDYGIGRAFGHLAYEVDDIYALCEKLMQAGVTINRPPRDGRMAFVRSPDNISIELLQKGEALPSREPWASMPNTGNW